jgi:hypothetical protein
MAKTFLTNINLKGNQLLNAVIHSASTAPSALAAGQLYFNTGDSTFYYSTGTGTGNWSPVGVQYISAVGSNLSVTDGELNISTSPSFNKITLTQDGNGENILIGNDAYIGDVDVANFIGIKGNEDDTTGGIKFGSSKTESISTDGSSNLTLTADNDIVLLPGSDYAYIGTPLIDGSNKIATLGDITGDLTGYLTTTDAATTYLTQTNADTTYLTKTDAGTTYLTQSDAATMYDAYGAAAGVAGDLSSHTGASSGVHGVTGSVVGTTDTQTLSNKTFSDSITLSGAGDFTITADSNIVLSPSGASKAYIGLSSNPDNQIATFGDITGDLTGYVTETGVETLTNKTIGDKLNFVGFTNPTDGYIWANTSTGAIEINAEYDLQLSPNGIVNIGNGFGELHLQKTEYWRDGTQQGIIAAQNDGSIRITGVNNGLQLETNSGDVSVTANENVSITSNNGNITLTPPEISRVILNGDTDVNNGLRVSNALTVGGWDNVDGLVSVQDANGSNVFTVTADGNNQGATAVIRGNLNFYQSLTGTNGNQYGSINFDGDQNLVINANQNNLVLQSDNSNSVYLGSVAADNKVATIGDLTSVQSGLTWKQAVNLLWHDSNAGLTGATGTLVIDGHSALTSSNNGYRILITSGTNAGIWSYSDDGSNWILTRSIDADTDAELKGAAIFIEEGTIYGATSWVQQNHYVTAFADQNWVQFSGQGTYIGSNSILIDGNEISVILDSDSLEITGSGLKVNPSTTGGLDIDGGLYVRTGAGLKIDSNNVQVDYTSLESQLVTDDFAKNADYSTVTRKYSTDIVGDSLVDSFTITHGLGTRDVQVRVYQTSVGPDTRYSDIEVDIKRSAANTNDVIIDFASAPATGTTYGVVVIG